MKSTSTLWKNCYVRTSEEGELSLTLKSQLKQCLSALTEFHATWRKRYCVVSTLKLLCHPIFTCQNTTQPSSQAAQTLPGSDETCIESTHPQQTADIYKPQQVHPWSKASFGASFLESARFTPAEQEILDVLLVNFSMVLLYLYRFGRGLPYYCSYQCHTDSYSMSIL